MLRALLGYDDSRIAKLKRSGVISGAHVASAGGSPSGVV